MKNRIFFYLIFVSVLSCCSENLNRVYFTIPSNDRKIILPVQLNDSITANMIFDSGASDGTFILDSSFVACHPGLVPDAFPDRSLVGSTWTEYRVLNLEYHISQPVKIGNTDLMYNNIQICNWKKVLQNNELNGMFNIPSNDTVHVWEWNFERNYLEIHPAENFKMPENSLIYPMEYPFYIRMSMQITCADEDTLTGNHVYNVDLGMPWDIAVTYPSKELEFFSKKRDAVWTTYMDGYFRHYTVNIMLADDFVMDSVRIYTFENSGSVRGYLLGQNFLKRFNVFFDMKNRQIGLLPIKNFQRIINPLGRRFHYLIESNSENKSVVTFMADYEKNYYKTAGLQVGDEVTAINDMLYKNITKEQKSEFYKEDTLVFDIIRAGQTMRIIVPVDKNEEQGD